MMVRVIIQFMSKKSKFPKMTLSIIFLIAIFFCIPKISCSAQDANSLISEVNALRAANGLAAYTVDPALSASAQAHSEYQASINTSTHNRADGSGIPARSENVCAGQNIAASYCVKQMWTDQLHLYTMIGLDSGTVGAGMAVGTDGTRYYTLQVNSSGNDTNLDKKSASTVIAPNINAGSSFIDIQAAPVQPGEFATSTPELDGSVYHTVQVNETLWTIAINYGTTIAKLQELNGMSPDDTSVVAGRRILIFYGGTPVADTLTPTVTPPPVTNTPKPTSTITMTLPPLASLTPTITSTPTPSPLIGHISFFDTPGARKFGFMLTIICGIGLLLTIFYGFYRT
ncbi:cysteine-rich secretory protein family/LysM domain [Flexilinea flocculi]|uniref:Cysteine-rich secretory protein family/LysM domain n=2 Tax=Flexilinea flocculi TaxID=1678840 RepID=A0A0K8PAR0_9CHLR|nr:cysteine-rich secretory protein family/LysM domain [Flexilinea flocculi]